MASHQSHAARCVSAQTLGMVVLRREKRSREKTDGSPRSPSSFGTPPAEPRGDTLPFDPRPLPTVPAEKGGAYGSGIIRVNTMTMWNVCTIIVMPGQLDKVFNSANWRFGFHKITNPTIQSMDPIDGWFANLACQSFHCTMLEMNSKCFKRTFLIPLL